MKETSQETQAELTAMEKRMLAETDNHSPVIGSNNRAWPPVVADETAGLPNDRVNKDQAA